MHGTQRPHTRPLVPVAMAALAAVLAACGGGPPSDRPAPALDAGASQAAAPVVTRALEPPPEPEPVLEAPYAPRPPGTLTFNADIAPIVFENCAGCHRPSGSAPFSLLTYRDVRKRAKQVVKVTRSGFMPPWLVPAEYGHFVGERRLSAEEIGMLAQWVDEGATEGDPADLPEAPQYPDGWLLGNPDLVVEIPERYTLPAGGGDVFRNFVIPDVLDETRYVRGVELRPLVPEVVHHAEVRLDDTPDSLQRDQRDPEPGFEGMARLTALPPQGHFVGWVPGNTPRLEPAATSWPLEAGTDLVLELHLQPSGKPEPVQVHVALHLTDEPPTRLPLIVRLGSDSIDIPPGEAHYWIEDGFRLPVDVEIESCWPHAHFLGRDLQAFAVLPGGEKRWLLRIPEWDFNWQEEYWFDPSVRLPAGTVVAMRYRYDNSEDNVNNPSFPPKRVVFGGNSTDEMGDFWLRMQTATPEDRALLRTAAGEHSREIQRKGLEARLAREPDTPWAIAALGYQRLQDGLLDEASRDFRRAIELDPTYALAHANLGAALCRAGRLQEGVEPLRTAIALHPQYYGARRNLARALARLGRLDEAIVEHRGALALRPNSARAHEELAGVLLQADRQQEALVHLRRAVALNPRGPMPMVACAWLLATQPASTPKDTLEALQLAERAVHLTDRKSAVALRSLAAAQARAGRFEAAVSLAEEAATLVSPPNPTLTRLLSEEAALYRAGRTRADG